jgi:ankyrin repeat protein
MIQPDRLKTDEYQPWSRGRGTDVWAMLKAAVHGDLAAVKSLVAKDPNLLECEYGYYRPLHFAVRENRVAVVRYLLEQGADPMCGGAGFEPAYRPKKSGNMQWPFDVARERGYHEVLALLESKVAETVRIVPEGEELGALIRARKVAQVRRMLDARPDVLDAADTAGNQPLHWAVMTRQPPLIDLLLDRGADINAKRPDGARPLDITNGDYHYRGWRDVPSSAPPPLVIISHLLVRGAEYHISMAARLGDLERVRTILDAQPELVNAVPSSSGYYNGVPIRMAAGAGHLEVVKLLLERGADPNAREFVAPDGAALYEAIAGKHWEVAKVLLEHGANPNAAVESSGNTMWRAKSAPAEIQRLMAERGGVLGLEMACHDGNVEYVEELLKADPTLAVDEYVGTGKKMLAMVMGYQPDILRKMHASGDDSPRRARWLLEHGLDPGLPNWLGITPLHRCALNDKRKMAELCLEFGAPIDPIDDEYSSTPLGWAARAGKSKMVKWLLAKGANPELPRDKPWARPIEWARRRGHGKIVALLQG